MEIHDYFIPWVTGADYCYGAYRVVVQRGERDRAALQTDVYLKSKLAHDYADRNKDVEDTLAKMNAKKDRLDTGFSLGENPSVPKFPEMPEIYGRDPKNPGFHMESSTYIDSRTMNRDDIIVLADFGEKVKLTKYAFRTRIKRDEHDNPIKDEYGKYVEEQYLHVEHYNYHYETPYTIIGQYVDMNPVYGSNVINSGIKKPFMIAVDRVLVKKYVINLKNDEDLLRNCILPSYDGASPRGLILRSKEIERRKDGREGDTIVHMAYLLSLSPDHPENLGWWTIFADAFLEELERMKQHPEIYQDKLSPMDWQWLNHIIADIEAQRNADNNPPLPATLEKVIRINKSGMPEEITPVDKEAFKDYIFKKEGVEDKAMYIPTTLYKMNTDVTKSLLGVTDLLLVWDTKAKKIADETWEAWKKLHPDLNKNIYPTTRDGRLFRISNTGGVWGTGFTVGQRQDETPVKETPLDMSGYNGSRQRLRIQRPWYFPTLIDAWPTRWRMTNKEMKERKETLGSIQSGLEAYWSEWEKGIDWVQRTKDYKIPILWNEEEWPDKEEGYELDDLATLESGVWTNNAFPCDDWSFVYMTNTPKELGRWVFARAQSMLYHRQHSKYVAFTEKYKPTLYMNRKGRIGMDPRFTFDKLAAKTGVTASGWADGAVLGTDQWEEPYFPGMVTELYDIWKLWFETDRVFWHNLMPYFSGNLFLMHAVVPEGLHYYDKKIAKNYKPQASTNRSLNGLGGYMPKSPTNASNIMTNDKLDFYAMQESFSERSEYTVAIRGKDGKETVDAWNTTWRPFAKAMSNAILGKHDKKVFQGTGFSFARNDPTYKVIEPDITSVYNYKQADGSFQSSNNAFDAGKYAITHVVKSNVLYIPMSFWRTIDWIINQETYLPFLRSEVLRLPPSDLHEVFWEYFPWVERGKDYWDVGMKMLEAKGFILNYSKNMTREHPPVWPEPVVDIDKDLKKYYEQCMPGYKFVEVEYKERNDCKPIRPITPKPGGG